MNLRFHGELTQVGGTDVAEATSSCATKVRQ
jgi:hypothetical protein